MNTPNKKSAIKPTVQTSTDVLATNTANTVPNPCSNNNSDNHLAETAPCQATQPNLLLNRRQFLFGTGAMLTLLTVPNWLRGQGAGQLILPAQVQAQIANYPRQLIGQLSQLTVGQAVPFNYPWEHPNAANILIKLGQPAGGSVGPDNDIVAFNTLCTHQGGPLAANFNASVGVAGPCPLHWTVFDLTRHGMVVSGHATLGLPQIILETEGDDIYATGILGLIFGYNNNLINPNN